MWPAFAFTALIMFRSQIAELFIRIKRGKISGLEIELDQLDKSAASIEQEVAELPPNPNPKIITPQQKAQEESVILKQKAQEESVILSIVSEASRSTKASLILLAIELEKLAREILATTGHLNGRRFIPLTQAITELDRKFGLPRHITSSLKLFWETRNRLIHGDDGRDEDILRAIDSGVRILKALQTIPREINVVYDPSVVLYSDPELNTRIPNVFGVILEARDIDGVSKYFRIFPTTRTYFKKGHQVTWEWNMDNVIGQAWYRDSDNLVQGAWSSSAEFIGRHLDEL